MRIQLRRRQWCGAPAVGAFRDRRPLRPRDGAVAAIGRPFWSGYRGMYLRRAAGPDVGHRGPAVVAQLLDLPLAWLSRSVWTRADDTVVSLSVKLSAAAAVLETIGLAALVAAVFRGRQLPAVPRKGREIQ